MTKQFALEEVQQHRDESSCWVILYGEVYDVTNFLDDHPGGKSIILRLAGQDATESYDPVHPPGTLESAMPVVKKLGSIDASTLPKPEATPAQDNDSKASAPDMTLEDCLNMDDIEAMATKRMSKKAWAYYYSAADDLLSKSLNNTVYRSILLRPRIFVDTTKCDTSIRLLGHRSDVPFFVSPAAQARLGHPDGEHGIARACATFGACQIISNNASQTPEQICEGAAPDQIFGWQLYVQNQRKKSEDMLARIRKIPSIKFIVLTLDAPVPGKREHDEREGRNVGASLPVTSSVTTGSASRTGNKADSASASASGGGGGGGGVGRAMFAGTACDLTWTTTLPWLAKHTDLPIVLKGVQTHEDAYMAAQHSTQIKGIILSNHGGRAADTAPTSIHTLLEIRKYCPQVFDKLEVWIDGGIKRGTDVVKALCLGATAVGLGRNALYGLSAGGQAGVERVFEILKAEVETAMRLLGAETINDLGLRHVNARAIERDIWDGEVLSGSLLQRIKAKL